MERCSSHPRLGSHTCRTPHNSFPPSFALGLSPTLAIMLIFFHGIHPQTSRDLLLALIPNPKMLILLTAHGKGFILLTCSPLARLVMHSETKAALIGGGQGEIRSCPREALAGGERASLLTPRRAQDSVPLPAGSPSEPMGGGAQPKSGLRRDEGTVWVAGAGGGIGEVESISGGLTFPQMALSGDVNIRKMSVGARQGQPQHGHGGRRRTGGILQLPHDLGPPQPLHPQEGSPLPPLS